MNMRILVKTSCFLIMICLVISCCGCFGDPVFGPEKVKGLPNTFRPARNPLWFLHFKASEDKILWVLVEDRTESVWKIKAIRDISLAGFRVTVGKMPEGFEQLIPEPPEKFRPVPGEEYTIHIHTKFMGDPNTPLPHIMPTLWTAEPSNESGLE